MKKIIVANIQNIDLVVQEIKNILLGQNIIVLLRGDLASGKTTLIKAYLKSIGIDDVVTSPTFCLQNIYSNDIYHYDLYNKTLQEFINLGLLEEFQKDGIHFIEWGEDDLKSILDEYGFNNISINIIKNKNKREYHIES